MSRPRDLELQAITWSDYKNTTQNLLFASDQVELLVFCQSHEWASDKKTGLLRSSGTQ